MKQQLKKENRMRIVLPAISVNEGVARAAVAAFCAQYDPSLSDLADIKCAVSEAVTNCIVHAYRKREGDVTITVRRIGEGVRIAVRDYGCGIADVARARQPLFTTDPQDERSGMGFTVMESFSDRLCVHSIPGRGTTVVMTKYFRTESN
jgi:stage II sporulation protein AB (anti-sigma F factor)